MRGIWVDEIAEEHASGGDASVPLYLTLPGARGGDIAALVERGILELADNGAIKEPERLSVVAIENSPLAVVELQKRIPRPKDRRAAS